MPTAFEFPGDFANLPSIAVVSISLDGRIYRFRFWPNARANDGKGAWYVDVYSAVGVPSILAVKVTITDDLLSNYRTAVTALPPGRLVVRRTDGVDDEPRPPRKIDGVLEIGTRVATLGSPLLVVEYVSTTEDARAT